MFMSNGKLRFTGIAAAGLAAAFLFGCGGQNGSPNSARSSGTAAMTAGTDDSCSGMMFRGGGMFGMAGSLIDLTADQKQQIKAILEKYRPAQGRHFNGNRPSPEQWAAKRDSMKTIRDSIAAQIRAILTPAQQALLDQVKAQLKAGTVPDTLIKMRVARLTTLLTLTPDQQTQAFTILKQDMQTRLAAKVKDTTAKGKEWRGKGKMHPGLPDAFMNILTDQQKQLLGRHQPHRG